MPSLLAVAPVDHPGGADIGLLRLLPLRRTPARARRMAELMRP